MESIEEDELRDPEYTSQSVITRLESGWHSFSIATLQRVARALDVKLVFGFEVDDADGDSEPSRSLVVVP